MKRAIALLVVTVTLGSTFGGGCSLIPPWGRRTLELAPANPVGEPALVAEALM